MDRGNQGRVIVFAAAKISPEFMRRLGVLLCLKLLFTILAVFVFARFSPLIDADLYLSGFYDSDAVFRTRIIQGFVLALSNIGPAVLVHWVFGVLSLSGVLYYYSRGGIRWQICIPLLLPSTLIWTSVIGKEAIFYGGFTLTLVIWSRFVLRKCDLIDYAFLMVGATICFVLRPHYALAICWLFVSALLTEKLNKNTWIWLCLVALFGSAILLTFAWDSLLYRGFGGIEPTARASRFVLLGIEPGTGAGFDTTKLS